MVSQAKNVECPAQTVRQKGTSVLFSADYNGNRGEIISIGGFKKFGGGMALVLMG